MTYDESLMLKCLDLLARQLAAFAEEKGAGSKRTLDKPTSDNRVDVKARFEVTDGGAINVNIAVRPAK